MNTELSSQIDRHQLMGPYAKCPKCGEPMGDTACDRCLVNRVAARRANMFDKAE